MKSIDGLGFDLGNPFHRIPFGAYRACSTWVAGEKEWTLFIIG